MSTEEPVLELRQGRLRGLQAETPNKTKFFAFKGIPYAKPPVGDLRFKAPEPAEPWSGVRDGTTDCACCAQLDRATGAVEGDEDCLLLNVFTPRLPAEDVASAPVMLYIHGGGFVHGCGTDPTKHGADFLVERGVVVVSINYRLGVLGFLCLDTPEAQGNMGLKDQVMALKWVKENIDKFGGDSENVTIFGISAGGASVEYLQLSKMAKGLFHKGILQSGSSLNPWAVNSGSHIQQLASRIAKLRGKSVSDDGELLKYLKSLPVTELVDTAGKVIASESSEQGVRFGFVPTIEKEFDGCEAFLTQEPYNLLYKGEYTKVPVISGVCKREGLLMVAMGGQIVEKIRDEKKLGDFLPFQLDDHQRSDLEKRLKMLYMDGSSGEEKDEFIIDFFTDVDFLGGAWVANKLKVLTGSPSHFYEFAYDGKLNYIKTKMNINRKGACHGDDGGYIMRSDILPTSVSKEDETVRERMTTMWTNFAKYGKPTPATGELFPTAWEPTTPKHWSYLEIDTESTMKSPLHPQRLRLFEHLYEKHWL